MGLRKALLGTLAGCALTFAAGAVQAQAPASPEATTTVLPGCVFSLLPYRQAADAYNSDPVNGQVLLLRSGQCQGTADAMVYDNHRDYCIPAGADNVNNIVHVTIDYANKHPIFSRVPLPMVMRYALSQEYPCK